MSLGVTLAGAPIFDYASSLGNSFKAHFVPTAGRATSVPARAAVPRATMTRMGWQTTGDVAEFLALAREYLARLVTGQ